MILAAIAGCSSTSTTQTPTDGGVDAASDAGAETSTATTLLFDLTTDFTSDAEFFNFPYPSDLRLDANGNVQGQAWSNPDDKDEVANLRVAASQHHLFPVVPVGWFSFDAPMPATLDENATIPASTSSPVLLVDVDPTSPDVGTLYPTVATVVTQDDYVTTNLLAVAPRPGIVLHGNRKYAFVVFKSLGDANGAPLGVPTALSQLLAGTSPGGAVGDAAVTLYAPLVNVLKNKLSIDPTTIAGATVFSTGDVVADLAALTDKMVAKYSITIDNLQLATPDGATHDRYCLLTGTVTYPQFQVGTPPFATNGLFSFTDGTGADALPAKQRDEVAPIAIAIPRAPMPSGGWPLGVYFHGSGGVSRAVVDRGKWVPQNPPMCGVNDQDTWQGTIGCFTVGEGPAYVNAPHGLAMAGSALPINPERVPGATEYDYLNLANLAAFRDTFRQGVIEQRLFIAALRTLQISPSMVSACTGMSLPTGETTYHFADAPLLVQGQSMGGMYTNIISAVEPRIQASIPTGAGGYWSYFITRTPLFDDTDGLIASLLSTAHPLSYLHPTLQLLQTAWETSDPLVFMPRLAHRPLPGHPTRSIYEPAGLGDSYFPTQVYDAVALAYQHPETGDQIWTSMQDALKLEGLDGLRPYPLTLNLTNESGTKYTGAIVQYMGDGVYDPHAIYAQLDAVKYQYGCFVESFLKTGKATFPAPQPLGTPCP